MHLSFPNVPLAPVANDHAAHVLLSFVFSPVAYPAVIDAQLPIVVAMLVSYPRYLNLQLWWGIVLLIGIRAIHYTN